MAILACYDLGTTWAPPAACCQPRLTLQHRCCRFWGTPIPIWASEDGEELLVVGSIEELEALTGEKVREQAGPELCNAGAAACMHVHRT
jgi:hypothetical protein